MPDDVLFVVVVGCSIPPAKGWYLFAGMGALYLTK